MWIIALNSIQIMVSETFMRLQTEIVLSEDERGEELQIRINSKTCSEKPDPDISTDLKEPISKPGLEEDES